LTGNSFVDSYFLQNYKIHKYFSFITIFFCAKYFVKELKVNFCKPLFITKLASVSFFKFKKIIGRKYVFLIVTTL